MELARNEGLRVYEDVHFKSDVNGLIVGENIALSEDLDSETERRCVLAEEIGHHQVNAGNILGDPYQEQKAHDYAIGLVLSVEMVVNAIIELKEDATVANVAERLDVTERFLNESLDLYSRRFEGSFRYGEYIVTFSPRIHVDYIA